MGWACGRSHVQTGERHGSKRAAVPSSAMAAEHGAPTGPRHSTGRVSASACARAPAAASPAVRAFADDGCIGRVGPGLGSPLRCVARHHVGRARALWPRRRAMIELHALLCQRRPAVPRKWDGPLPTSVLVQHGRPIREAGDVVRRERRRHHGGARAAAQRRVACRASCQCWAWPRLPARAGVSPWAPCSCPGEEEPRPTRMGSPGLLLSPPRGFVAHAGARSRASMQAAAASRASRGSACA